MKKFFSLFLAVLLIFSCWTAATAESTDAVSGAPLDNDIEIVYKEHFDDMVTRYADELTEAELLVSADVYDAIGMIRLRFRGQSGGTSAHLRHCVGGRPSCHPDRLF